MRTYISRHPPLLLPRFSGERQAETKVAEESGEEAAAAAEKAFYSILFLGPTFFVRGDDGSSSSNAAAGSIGNECVCKLVRKT